MLMRMNRVSRTEPNVMIRLVVHSARLTLGTR